jgi:glycosyltransferase involved in cell wall biosynthesis
MRIAMISEHASPLAAFGGEDAGGQNTHVAELSAALAAAGHDVRVYTRRDDPALPAAVATDRGVTVVHVPAGPARVLPKDALLPYMDGFGRWLDRQWQQDDGWTPDVIHAHFWMSGLAALVAAEGCGAPVVQTFHALGTVKRRHQGDADTSPPDRIQLERRLGRAVDRIIAQCRDEVAELARMGVPADLVTVVPSGVDTRRFTPDGPFVPRTPGRLRVLSVGRLVERKGFAEIAEAMRYVPEAELVIVGGPADGPFADALRARGARLVGAVAAGEVADWYRSADVVAAAPWYEPFGLTPLEAMACGVPVVATAVGGLTDTVVDGVTGDLVPPHDPRALGITIGRLLDDDLRRFTYAGAALDRVRREYTWQDTAARIEAVYSDVRHSDVRHSDVREREALSR